MSTCKCKNNQTDNLKELDEILETYGKKKGYLITILQKAQDAYGYISIDIMNRISEFTGIKVAKIYGVATFYAQFRLQPIGNYLIMLCQGTACHVNGSEMISQVISEQLNIKDGETTEDGLFTLKNKINPNIAITTTSAMIPKIIILVFLRTSFLCFSLFLTLEPTSSTWISSCDILVPQISQYLAPFVSKL